MNEMNRISNLKLVVSTTVGTSAFSFFRGQLAWFRNQGWDVTLVSTPDDKAKLTAERERVGFIGIAMRREIAPLRDLQALLGWIQLLRKHAPDAINVGTPKAALLGITAAWLTRVPRRLYMVRGLRLEGARRPLRWILWFMEKITMSLATDVMYVSQSLAEEAGRRRLLPREKAWVVGSGSSNGVNAQAIVDRVEAVDRESLRNELGFGTEDFVVGFVGRINRDKGIDTLARAFQDPCLSREVRGLLIGEVEDPTLFEEIQSIGDRIHSMTWTDDVWGKLPAMDILCLPTLREGFPNVVLEAAAAGVPTITTRATGAVDSVVPGETGVLIEVGDDRTLVDRLNELCRDRSIAGQMGRAARQHVFEEYAQERIWEGLAEILSASSSPQHAVRVGKILSGREVRSSDE